MLDFYLLGLARSGTSAFVTALNLHPNIYCGLERFTIQTDPASIKFPDSFLDPSLKGNELGLNHAIEHLKNNNNIQAFQSIGDKLPRKFYCPSHLAKTKNNIVIYRSYKNVTQSWDARAGNLKDTSWDNHRTGFFFFWDLLIFFNALPLNENIAVINFDELYFGEYRQELSAVFKTLGLPGDLYPYASFEQQLLSQKKKYVKECHNDRYNTIANHIKLTAFEDDFFNSGVPRRLSILKDYAAFIKNKTSDFFDFLMDMIEPEKEQKELFNVISLIVNNFTPKELDFFSQAKTLKMKSVLSLFEKDSQANLEKICELFPACALPQHKLSRFYAQNNVTDKAIKRARKAIDLKGDDPNFYHHLAGLLLREGDLDGAEEAQQQAIKINPDIPGFHMLLSHVYTRKNRIDKAIEEAHKAIDLKSDDPNFYHHLAGLLLRVDNPDSAEEAQQHAIEMNPDVSMFHMQLSHIYNRKNMIDKAIEEARKAIDLKGDDPNFHKHLNALVKKGRGL